MEGGWALEIVSFMGPDKWHQAERRMPFWDPKNRDFQDPTPPTFPRKGYARRGLQFYTFFGISIGITRRLIDIGEKITFFFLQNV